MMLTIENGQIKGKGFAIRAEYPVIEAVMVEDRVLVPYDHKAFHHGGGHNLFCYSIDGSILWQVTDNGRGGADAYVSIIEKDPLWVESLAGLNCRIDENNGEVLAKVRRKRVFRSGKGKGCH